MKIRLLLIIFISILASTCKKNEGPVTTKNQAPELSGGVLVLNEGQFNGNNASITYRNEKGEVSQDVFYSVNDQLMGDVLQSATDIKGELYLILNNSQKIDVVGSGDLKVRRSITGFRSPRYILDVEDGKKALVSNLKFDDGVNEINIVDLEKGVITGSIPVKGWCEQMLKVDNRIYIANLGMDQVIVLDGKQQRTIPTPPQPSDLVADADGNIWILCTGGFQSNQAALCRYSPTQNKLTSTLRFSNPDAFPSSLVIDESGKRLYFLENGLYAMSIYADSIPVKALLPQTSSFYGIGIQPGTGNIYVGDAVDYISKGVVHIYSSDGSLLDSFDAGYLPRSFVFR